MEKEINTSPAAALVVVLGGGHVLAVKSRIKLDGNGNQIVGLPCGKIESGEFPHLAALRELAEETGYVLAPQELERLGPMTNDQGKLVEVYFHHHYDPSHLPVADSEECTVHWMEYAHFMGSESIYQDFNIKVLNKVLERIMESGLSPTI